MKKYIVCQYEVSVRFITYASLKKGENTNKENGRNAKCKRRKWQNCKMQTQKIEEKGQHSQTSLKMFLNLNNKQIKKA